MRLSTKYLVTALIALGAMASFHLAPAYTHHLVSLSATAAHARTAVPGGATLQASPSSHESVAQTGTAGPKKCGFWCHVWHGARKFIIGVVEAGAHKLCCDVVNWDECCSA